MKINYYKRQLEANQHNIFKKRGKYSDPQLKTNNKSNLTQTCIIDGKQCNWYISNSWIIWQMLCQN